MLVRDVRYNGDVEVDRTDAVLGEAVRGRLQHCDLGPGVAHLRQQSLDVGRIGRRGMQPCVVALVADDRIHGADHGRADAGRLEDAEQNVRSRGLAVGARDPDDRHAAAGMAVPGRVEPRERGPAVIHLHVGNGPVAGLRLAGHRHRAAPKGIGHVLRAVHPDAAVGHKQSARHDLARIGGNERDLDAEVTLHRPDAGQGLNQLSQAHGSGSLLVPRVRTIP